jgi:hypothetical protein
MATPVCTEDVDCSDNAQQIFWGGRFGEKKNFGELIKQIWFRVCSVTAEMFEHGNSGENWMKRSEFFFQKFTEGI